MIDTLQNAMIAADLLDDIQPELAHSVRKLAKHYLQAIRIQAETARKNLIRRIRAKHRSLSDEDFKADGVETLTITLTMLIRLLALPIEYPHHE